MHLQRTGGDVVEHPRHRRLHRRDVRADVPVVVVLVDQPCGAQDEQPELLDLDPRVGDHRLHELLAPEQGALGRAGERPLAHHRQRLLHQPDRPHRVVDPPTAEPGLRHGEPVAAFTEKVVGGHAHLAVTHEGVSRGAAVTPVQTDVADDLDARRVGWHDEHRHPPVLLDIGIGHRQHDQERGEPGVGGEPLLPVDHPLVAVELVLAS